MSAQKAQAQSMEDILASIRKIISEDSREEPASVASDDEQVVEANPTVNSFTPAIQSAKPAPQPSPTPLEANTPAAPISNSPEPSVLVKRREILAESFASEPDTASQSAPVASVETAPETAPETVSAKTVPPETVTTDEHIVITDEHVEGKIPEIENPPSGLAQSAPGQAPRTGAVISNARDFVAAQDFAKSDFSKSNSPGPENMEKPVFAQSTISSNSSLAVSMDPLISPDSVERREEDERRSHPMRRGADRDEEAFKTALMSPQTNEAVLSAFEQLKNSATDNLDGKVEALLRPMLRDWLDNNLPSMVERLVRDEIERVSRGE